MFHLHHWHLPENSTMQLHVAKLPMKIPVNKYKRIESSFRTLRCSYILRITYPVSSVTPSLAGPGGRRQSGMWQSPEPPPAVVDLAWGPHTRHGAGSGNLQGPVSATRATSNNQRAHNSDNVDYASFRPVFNVVSMLYQLLFDIESMFIINIVSMLSRCWIFHRN